MKSSALGWWLAALGLIGACGGRSQIGGAHDERAAAGGAAVSGGSMAGRSNGTGGAPGAGGSRPGTGGTTMGTGGTAARAGAGGSSGSAGGTPSSGTGGAGGVSMGGRSSAAGSTSAGSGGSSGSSAGAGAMGGEGGSPDTDCVVRVAQTGSDSNSGNDWSDAVATVQRGLDVAGKLVDDEVCASVEVWVATGVYRPSARSNPLDERSATFRLLAGVALYGGFAGGESSRSERSIFGNVATLSGDIGAQGDDSDNSYHVVTGATGATLDGFTVSGGFANGVSIDLYGGGMLNDGASPLVANCTFLLNSAGGGGAMFNRSSAPEVTDTWFQQNGVSFGNGGGMLNRSASPRVSHCAFVENSAQYQGGGMSNEVSSTPEVTDTRFDINEAGDSGGAMHNDTSQPSLTNCLFLDNSSYLGGAIDNYAASPPILNSTFIENSAYEGGAVSNWASLPVMTNDIFIQNSAAGTARFTGEAFASGGAIYDAGESEPTITGCTFTRNTAAYSGGAIHNADSSVDITDTILWGDRVGTSVSEIVAVDTIAVSEVRYSIVEGGFPGGLAVVDSDPLFLDGANGGAWLSAGSPAIDAGSGCPLALLDHAGQSRWDIASVDNVLSAFDIGALEYQGAFGTDTIVDAVVCP